jgi:AraC family transcriptional regulator
VTTDVQTAADGRRSTTATAGAFEITRLEFPPGFRHGLVDPERPYVAVVLEGAVRKSFPRDAATIARGELAVLPAGAAHSSTFSLSGAKIVAIRPTGAVGRFGRTFERRRCLRAVATAEAARRMSAELDCRDASAELALEGLALQLLAGITRAGAVDEGRTGWVRAVRDALHERVPAQPTLTELSELVGRHPTHVARAFRREYGQTIGAYARTLRLDWATAQLAGGAPIGRVAHDAGFADQSHFTRAFRLHTGTTPGKFRARLERD